MENKTSDYSTINESISKKTTKELLGEKYNKASLFNEEERKKIADKVITTYETDKTSRKPRETKWDEILEIIQEDKISDKSKIDPNRSKIVYPVIKQACKKWASEAYPLLIQDGNIVKAKPIGNDDGKVAVNKIDQQPLLNPTTQQPVYSVKPGKKVAKAQRRVEFDNFVILNEIEGYEKGADELLYRLPMYGTYFKKVYFNRGESKAKVDILFPHNVVVNENALDNRYTVYSQELFINYNDIISKQKSGIFLDISLDDVLEDSVEEDVETKKTQSDFADEKECPQLFIEQHRWLDLDGDNFLEPYIVIVHKDSQKLFGIYSRYTEEDITYKDKKIIDIKSRDYFVKYDFCPSSDGKFYSDGLGDLLFHTNNIVDTLLNQLVDAGSLANRSGGFISKSLKKRAGDVNLGIGEWKFVDTFGINMRDAFFPIDHKEPSVVLFSLLQFILQGSKELSGSMPSLGENPGNIAPMTMMAIQQEGSKEFKAVYKRVFRSLKKEILLIEDVIRDNIDDTFSKMYVKVLDDKEANFKADYNNKDYDIIPVADSQMVTSSEKASKVSFIMNLMQNPVAIPYLKIENILRDALEVVNYPDINDIIQTPPPPQPDPTIELKQMELKLKEMQITADANSKLEKEKSERLRIQVANSDLMRKNAEQAVKALEMDYKLGELEAKIENIVADSMKKVAETKKIMAETGSTLQEAVNVTEGLYEPAK